MYLFRDAAPSLVGPGCALGAVPIVFALGFWLAMQAGANLAVVVVNFFTTLPVLLLGIAMLVHYRDTVPLWWGGVVLMDLLWILANPVRHSVAELARESIEFGGFAWLVYLDSQVVEWAGCVVLLFAAVMLFRRRY